MPVEILMPALSPTMEEGKLARWLVKEGDTVTSGMVIAEIETDKATMEVEAVEEGSIGRILIAEGTDAVKVNTPIALLLEEGEALSDAPPPAQAAPASQPAAPAPEPQPSPAPVAATAAAAAAPAAEKPRAPVVPPSPPAQSQPTPAPTTMANGKAGERIFASPLARRLAKEAALDLAQLSGSGPHGRIIKRDVEAAIAAGPVASAPATAALTPQPAALQPAGQSIVPAMADNQVLMLYEQGSYDVVPHDGMRRIIAQRLTQSKQTIPHFYMSLDCVLDELLRARTRINEASPEDGPRSYKLSVNDFVIKALALALQQVPAANATWTDDGMLQHRHSDVGVAVAVEGGL
ncbi:MAG: 2-oxo acid dehydrogenase subunit E2, partial [Hyphomicrobiaceae bacterium]